MPRQQQLQRATLTTADATTKTTDAPVTATVAANYTKTTTIDTIKATDATTTDATTNGTKTNETKTTTVAKFSSSPELEIQSLFPLMMKSSPSFFAVVFRAKASLPDPDSERQKLPAISVAN